MPERGPAVTKLNANVRAWGDTSAYVGPQFTPYTEASPTDDLDAAMEDLGWLSEDGVAEAIARDSKEVKANGGKTVRVLRTSDARTFKIQCLETRASVLGLTRPGSTPVSTGATAEVQTVTVSGAPTGGSILWVLPGYGQLTETYNAATTKIATDLSALVGGTVTVSGTAGSSYVVTFPEELGDVPTLQLIASLTGGTAPAASVAVTTPGVSAVTVTRVKTSTQQDLRVFILDMADGSIHRRVIIPEGEVTAVADISHNGGNETVYELTITPYPQPDGAMYIDITDDPAQAA